MSGKTHAAVAAAVGVWTGGMSAPAWTLAVVLGGMLPDVDEPWSAIGRRLWWLAWPLKLLVGHRTLSHSILGVIGAGTVIWFIGLHHGWTREIPLGIMLGMLIHILLDALSGSVMVWWPRPTRVSVARWPVFGWQDRILCGLAGFAAIVGLGLAGHQDLGSTLSGLLARP
ncbi:MAG: metal-dependent hydrolase [Nitrospirota bacterium]